MKFCSVCSNMYYINISQEDQNRLEFYCRQCGNTDKNIDMSSISVSKTVIKKNKQKFSHIINEYTKLDPTLPRINTIDCPNQSCSTNTEHTEKEIIYIRYDDINMKYVYLCYDCETIWKINE